MSFRAVFRHLAPLCKLNSSKVLSFSSRPSFRPIQRSFASKTDYAHKSFIANLKEAASHASKGRFDQALILANVAFAQNSKSVEAISLRAEIYRNLGQIDAALADCGQVLAIDPTNINAHAMRGLLLIEKQDYQTAISHFNSLLTGSQLADNPEFRLNALQMRASCFMEISQFHEALADATELIVADPKNPDWLRMRALAHYALRDAAGSAADLRKVHEMDQSLDISFLNNLDQLVQQGKTDQALALIERTALSGKDLPLPSPPSPATSIATDSASLLTPFEYLRRARAHAQNQEFPQAKSDLQNALANPAIDSATKFEASLLLGQICSESGDAAAAFQLLKTAAEIQPNDFTAQTALYESAKNIGDWVIAEKAISECLKQRKMPEFFVGRAECYQNMGKLDEAHKEILEALKINANLLPAYLLRSQIHMQQENQMGALDDLKKAYELDPFNHTLLVVQAQVLNTMEKFEDAIQIAQSAIQKDPTNPDAFCVSAYAKLELQKFDEVQTEAGKAIELSEGGLFHAWFLRGAAQMKKNLKSKEAVSDLSECIRLNPQFGFAYAARAECYAAQGRTDLAMKDAKMASSLMEQFEKQA